jgi:hypothetical protein
MQGEVFTLDEPSEKEEDKYGVEELRKKVHGYCYCFHGVVLSICLKKESSDYVQNCSVMFR